MPFSKAQAMPPDPGPEEAIFAAALQWDTPAQREAYLDQACAGNPQLRAQVESLLRASSEAETFLERPVGVPKPESAAAPVPVGVMPLGGIAAAEGPGSHVGRYKLLQQIGEGGCGTVFMAEQEEPVRRRVALKVIKLGMDTKSVVARFEAERQALAMMDHPNIAKVLDAGATDSGRPYFVMELVRGIPITRYCDDNKLTTQQRLDLFIQVCHAIQHAHQKGIIHRDIKPSNILVTLHDGQPVPKVIDFGIAKATEGRLTDLTLFTAFEQFIGTPAYMSPEQAEMGGLDIDTRSDIYALGVLLYELLTGKTPFDAKELVKAGLDEMRRRIREVEPQRPSTRLSTLRGEMLTHTASAHGTDAPKLINLIRGDLDWIVMKCLEKDRTRRYETANGLAADLKRHLGNEPVVARPPSAIYRLQKSFQRNRLAFSAAACVLVSMIWAIVFIWLAAHRESQARVHESIQRNLAEQRGREASTNAASATAGLYQALVREARATRIAQRVGYRNEVLGLLKRANALETPLKDRAELRLEAMLCLGDFRGFKPRTLIQGDEKVNFRAMKSSPDGRTLVVLDEEGGIRICELPGGRELLYWKAPMPMWDVAFLKSGRGFFASGAPTGDDTFDPRVSASRAFVATFAIDDNGHWRLTDWKSQPGLYRLYSMKSQPVGVFGVPGDGRDETGVRLVLCESGEVSCTLSRPSSMTTAAAPILRPGITNEWNRPGFFRPEVSALDPQGRWLAIGEYVTNTQLGIDIWDLATRSKRATLLTDLSEVNNLEFSGEGDYLVLSSGEGAVIFRTTDFQPIDRIACYIDLFSLPSFSPRQPVLVLPLVQQNRLLLRHYLKQETWTAFEEPEGLVTSAFSSSGESLLTLSRNKVKSYDLIAASEHVELTGHRMSIPGIAFSPDGRWLASVGKEKSMKVWDAVNGKLISIGSHPLPAQGQAVCFSPDSSVVCSGDYQTHRIQFWEAATGRKLLEVEDSIGGRTWSLVWVNTPSGESKLIRASDFMALGPGLSSWRIPSTAALRSGAPEACIPSDNVRLGVGVSLVSSPEGQNVAYLGGSWEKGWQVMTSPVDKLQQTNLLVKDVGFTVQGLAFASKGSQLIVGCGKNLSVLDTKSGMTLRTIRETTNRFFSFLALSPDERWLAVESDSKLGVDIYDFTTGTLRYRLPDREGTVYWFAWQPGAPRLAVARDNGAIGIWDLNKIDEELNAAGLGLSSVAGDRSQRNP